MKNLKFLLIALLAVSLFFACKKKDKAPATSVVGYWKGLYGLGANTPEGFYAFLFRNNGTVRVYNLNADTTAANKAEGTYTVSGTTVNTTYTYGPPSRDKYSTSATVNAAFTSMTGTWGDGNSSTGGGTFNLTKQ